MPEIKIEIEVWCSSCGEGLCNQSRGVTGGIEVKPCEKCMQQKYDDGCEYGYERGQKEK